MKELKFNIKLDPIKKNTDENYYLVVDFKSPKINFDDFPKLYSSLIDFEWSVLGGYGIIRKDDTEPWKATWYVANIPTGEYVVHVSITVDSSKLDKEEFDKLIVTDKKIFETELADLKKDYHSIGSADSGPIHLTNKSTRMVSMSRAGQKWTDDMQLWEDIENGTSNISWRKYKEFMDAIFCQDSIQGEDKESQDIIKKRFLPFPDTDRYRLLKVATEVFLMSHCGVAVRKQSPYERVLNVKGSEFTIPYLALIQLKLRDVPIKPDQQQQAENCYGILQSKLTKPCCIELIWSYWHEEGMLVQTMNAIIRRFQNISRAGDRDPLSMLEIDPLRPLNNLLWGYVQDEQHRLTLPRRAYEYNHQYGMVLQGKAVPTLAPADSRSKFLEAFHNLISRCAKFYQESDNTMIIADGFPVLNAIKEVHLILSEGAHNQYGDLPWTARQEMLMQQWLLARPEFREFLPTRIMVAYPEEWMDRVDAMKSIQGWTDASILHFRDLANDGEKILLSIRFGKWSDIDNRDQASNWALYWRDKIQGYAHAYRAVTGVDLTAEITDTRQAVLRNLPPSVHLRNRLATQLERVSTR